MRSRRSPISPLCFLALVALAGCPSSKTSAPADGTSPPQPVGGDTAGGGGGGGSDRVASVAPSDPDYARVEGTSYQNACKSDQDCRVGGCSAEICSSQDGVSSTCIAKDWPSVGSSCGCVSGQCMWFHIKGAPRPGGAGGGAGSGFQSGSGSGSGTGTDTSSGSGAGTGTGSGSGAGTGTGTGSGSGTGAGTGASSGSGAGSGPGMGQKCGAGDRCAKGLTCVKYYGIAGARGPQFATCEIRCGGKSKGKCPAGTHCVTIADGPGQVCRK